LVWKDDRVAKFIGENFISLRATIDIDEYTKYSAEYKTSSTPTVLLLAPDGKEIDRIIGFEEKEKDNYIQSLEDMAWGRNTLGDILTRLEKNPEDVNINFKLANKYMARFELSKAQPFFKRVIKLDPEDTNGHKTESTFHVATYEAKTNQNIELLKAFITTDPDEKYLAPSYTLLAAIYQGAEDTEKVIATYKEALKKMPENGTIMFSYANAIFSNRLENLYELGLELNQKAKMLEPELEMSSYFVLAGYYKLTKNTDMVVKTFEEAIQKFPRSFGLKRNYADFIYRNKVEYKYNRGIQLAEIVRDANPRASMSWFTLGQLYYLKGDLAQAREAVKKAVEFNPERSTYKKTLEKFEQETHQ